MITIEFNEEKYNLPNSWYDITIGQFQQIVMVDQELSELEKNIELVKILSFIPEDILNDLPYTEFCKLTEAMTFINSEFPDKVQDEFEIDGQLYKLDKEISKMSTSMFLDLDTFTKSPNDNLHITMAILYRPVVGGKIVKYNSDEVYERADLFKDKMIFAHAITAFFFSGAVAQNFLKITQDSL